MGKAIDEKISSEKNINFNLNLINFILSDSDFNKEDGVKLNPYINSENLIDKEVVVIQEIDLTDLPCFNIRNTDIGIFFWKYIV